MNTHKNSLQMLFVVLPKFATDTYSAVKKRACIEFGSKILILENYKLLFFGFVFFIKKNFVFILVPSQCFVAKNGHNDSKLMSICSKLVVQMNAKLGGEPWKVQIPLKVKNMHIFYS